MAAKSTLYEVQSKALETAQRFADYRSYHATESRAVAALQRRCTGWNKEQCQEWFAKAVAVHKAGISYVKEHEAEAFEIYHRDRKQIDFDSIADSFVARYTEFPRDLLVGVLTWNFYWYHLR